MLIDFMEAGGKPFSKPIVVSVGKGGSKIVDHRLGKLPAYFEGFSQRIGVTVETLDHWQDVHPEFSEAYKKAKSIQLRHTVDGLISQNYNPAGSIFFLKNCHGWRDTQPDEEIPSKSETHYHLTLNLNDSKEHIAGQLLSALSKRVAPSSNNGS